MNVFHCFITLMLVSCFSQDVSSAAPTDAPSIPCSISVSDPVSGLDSISLTVITPGHNCSFTVTSPDAGGDDAECRRGGGEEIETNEIGAERERGEEEVKEEMGANYLGTNETGVEDGGEVFICALDQLEAGTSYQLQIQSQRDEEAANVTLHTSESSQPRQLILNVVIIQSTCCLCLKEQSLSTQTSR